MAIAVSRVTKRTAPLRTAKEIRDFTKRGLYAFGSDILIEANRIEISKRPPNEPTAFTLDGRTRPLNAVNAKRFGLLRPGQVILDGWRRKISLTYGFSANIFEAVQQVYLDLIRLTRVKTGAGVDSIYFWCSDKDNPPGIKLTGLNQVRRWLEDPGRGRRVAVHILGPTVVYRRKLTYFPRGSSVFTKDLRATSRARLRGTAIDRFQRDANNNLIRAGTTRSGKPIDFLRIREAIHRIVVRRNKRRFPGTWMSYGFVPSREALPPDPRSGKKFGQGPGAYGNIPVIYVGGSLRR